MPVKGKQRLTVFNKTLNGNAAYIDIQRNMIDHFPIQGSTIDVLGDRPIPPIPLPGPHQIQLD
jgi:hypothetical protein